MTTYNEWKFLAPVVETVKALIGIDVRQLGSWAEYKDAVYRADRSKVFDRAEKLATEASTGEFAVLVTTLATMDYAALAVDLERKHDRSLLACWQYTTGDHAKAVAGAMGMGA
jgi:hypothetical protein